MGQNFSSEPVVAKDTERDHNDTFTVAVSSCQGWRMSQEDNHSLILDLPGVHKASFFAVYDGHGSARVSKHASEALWRHLSENELYSEGKFKEALESAFLTFDREVNESYNAQLAGTTAICVLIVDNVVYCANIGDSRALAAINCECIPLSHDHKPENPLELDRITAAGGFVIGNRVNGNLALSRAFGDFHYKGNISLPPEQQIVSPHPDIKRIELNDDLDFLVLACDGIWDVLSSEAVVEFVISRLEKSMEVGLICEQLTTRCLAPDYELVLGCDNMTVLIVCYTRGRSWEDYCTDVFNKNSKRLGFATRAKPVIDESSISNSEQDPSSFLDHAKDMRRILSAFDTVHNNPRGDPSSSWEENQAEQQLYESTLRNSSTGDSEQVEDDSVFKSVSEDNSDQPTTSSSKTSGDVDNGENSRSDGADKTQQRMESVGEIATENSEANNEPKQSIVEQTVTEIHLCPQELEDNEGSTAEPAGNTTSGLDDNELVDRVDFEPNEEEAQCRLKDDDNELETTEMCHPDLSSGQEQEAELDKELCGEKEADNDDAQQDLRNGDDEATTSKYNGDDNGQND